ncbi:hypothetical protein M0R04_05800 [Candidatus Dojkabacteria bacterium]|jgi:tetratricopeptide (TPR) repeat protein|nr:hypothetical protein [Candidatus Dojkabacteria bacterium]
MPVDTKKKLAVIAISGDEEKWVEQWAKSLLPIADLFVINLTQYGDNTEASFRKFIPEDKLILVKYPWEKNFSKARNQGLEYVPDWVDYCIYVDMDEVISEDSIPDVKRILNDSTDYVVLCNIYNTLDQEGMLASLFYPRMFPWKIDGKKTNPVFESTVHNQLIIDKKIPVIRPKISVIHYGYALSKEEMEKKHQRSEELLREQIRIDNDNFFAHLNLAQLLRAKADFVGTEKHANEVLRIIVPKLKNNEERYLHAFIMAKDQLATALMAQRRFEEAVPHIKDTIDVKPDHLDSLMSMGNTQLELKNFEQAEFWYKRYLFIKSRYDVEKDNTNLILNHLNSSFIVLYNLGVVKAIQGDIATASEYFLKAYKEEPTFRDVFIKYAHTLRMLGKNKEMNDEINTFMAKQPKNTSLVYEYFSDIALENCDIELAKFNAYQASNLGYDKDKDIQVRINRKWESLKSIFGDVSMSFFDISTSKNRVVV